MRRSLHWHYLFLLCIPAFFASCTKDSDDTLRTPAEFYPLEVGRYIIWDVDSINYHEAIPNDTSHTQVKEILVDTFYDNLGLLNYRIERYTRPDDTSDFMLQNVWSVCQKGNNIEKTENNLRFIKLVAPVMDGVQWDGNAYLGGLFDLPYNEECNRLNYLEGWDYVYANLDASMEINGMPFDRTVTVNESGADNLIEYDNATEIYAAGVGLIQKEFYHYYTQDLSCPDCPWTQRVQCGYSVIMRIVAYH
ncbi:MAG: hypothetical protein R2794_13535 [Chitinophagales bacterium]